MSQENVEVVREVAEIWNSAGWQGVADRGLLHPKIEYHDDRRWPEARSAVGTGELVQRFDEVLEVLGEGSQVEVEQLLDAAEDQVVLIFRFRGVARASGIHHDYRWGYVCRVRDGQIVYMQAYLEPEKALEAAGLSE
jgi:ketosteroid isomerase-like protein